MALLSERRTKKYSASNFQQTDKTDVKISRSALVGCNQWRILNLLWCKIHGPEQVPQSKKWANMSKLAARSFLFEGTFVLVCGATDKNTGKTSMS